MSTCPSCGTDNPSGRPRCAACGAKIPPTPQEEAAENGASERSGAPFQALGSVELKRVRRDEAASVGAPAPPEPKKPEGRKKALTLPEILPLGTQVPEEADDLPVHAAQDLPAPEPIEIPPAAREPEPAPRAELSADILEQLADYATDGALSAAATPKARPPLRAPKPVAAPQRVPTPGGTPLPVVPEGPLAFADEPTLSESAPAALRESLEAASRAGAPAGPAPGRPSRAAPRPSAVAAVAPGAAPLELDEADDAAPLELDTPGAPAAPPPRAPAAPPPSARPRAIPEVVVATGGGRSAPVATYAAPTVFGDGAVVGAPPLPPELEIPEVIRSLPAGKGGLVSRIGYGLKAPALARHQKEVLGYMAAHLARLRKQEADFAAALGRAARKHGLAPDEAQGLVTAADREESRSQGARPAPGSSPELARLEEKHDSMTSRVLEAHKRLAEAEARFEGLKAREGELKRPPGRGANEAVAAARVREYENVKAERQRAEVELQTYRGQATAAEAPLKSLEAEMARLGRGVDAAAPATAATIQIDQDLGRAILKNGAPPAALRGIVQAVETCQARIKRWEQIHGEQQTELGHFDARKARSGFWMLALGTLGVLALLVAGGEAVRQIILALEG